MIVSICEIMLNIFNHMHYTDLIQFLHVTKCVHTRVQVLKIVAMSVYTLMMSVRLVFFHASID